MHVRGAHLQPRLEAWLELARKFLGMGPMLKAQLGSGLACNILYIF
uniref:Uncharacterized protein n=1 Tax=Nelumbo nucifera TaxID=4432 RepID=A0A822Y9I7_NELNU|nr:TPA_asm: hypothetical protein HUJ06_030231 [Nelumbo nucifera]